MIPLLLAAGNNMRAACCCCCCAGEADSAGARVASAPGMLDACCPAAGPLLLLEAWARGAGPEAGGHPVRFGGAACQPPGEELSCCQLVSAGSMDEAPAAGGGSRAACLASVVAK